MGNDGVAANDEPQESPLAKRTIDSFESGMTQVNSRIANVRVVTPAKNVIVSQPVPSTHSKADLAAPTPVPLRKEIQPMDVFWAMVNDITGKDKLAKFGQYSLRLLLYHAKKSQDYLSDDNVNIKSISRTYTSNDKILNLLVNFIYEPRAFARIVGILMCSIFTSRCAAFVPALATFRQLLRFGKSPFRLRRMWLKLRENIFYSSKTGRWTVGEGLLSKSTIGELISLYYSLNDEALLLFKLKFLLNGPLRTFAGHHEAYAWYCDSWFAMYNSINSLLKLSQQEMETRILIQVKKRSRILSKQILGSSSFHTTSHMNNDDDDKDAQALNDIKFKITNAKLDILKTASDIIFNSYTVFNAPLHFDTIQIWTGISASFLSSVKLYREKHQALTNRS